MKLEEVKRPYDLVISLGSACAPAAHMRRHNLRRFSMPFDWVVSKSLSDVSRLLKNKFDGFMELHTMRQIEGSADFVVDEIVQPVKSHFIKDIKYNIISVHDFPVHPNQEWTTHFPSYKDKLNSRVNRFLDEITKCQSALFVRWDAKYEEVIELRSVLSEITKCDFQILVINPSVDLRGVEEMNWELEQVCIVNVPTNSEDEEIWDTILNGITLTDIITNDGSSVHCEDQRSLSWRDRIKEFFRNLG